MLIQSFSGSYFESEMWYETEKKAAAKMPLNETIGYTKQRMTGGKKANGRRQECHRTKQKNEEIWEIK